MNEETETESPEWMEWLGEQKMRVLWVAAALGLALGWLAGHYV